MFVGVFPFHMSSFFHVILAYYKRLLQRNTFNLRSSASAYWFSAVVNRVCVLSSVLEKCYGEQHTRERIAPQRGLRLLLCAYVSLSRLSCSVHRVFFSPSATLTHEKYGVLRGHTKGFFTLTPPDSFCCVFLQLYHEKSPAERFYFSTMKGNIARSPRTASNNCNSAAKKVSQNRNLQQHLAFQLTISTIRRCEITLHR